VKKDPNDRLSNIARRKVRLRAFHDVRQGKFGKNSSKYEADIDGFEKTCATKGGKVYGNYFSRDGAKCLVCPTGQTLHKEKCLEVVEKKP
jgi:hypothetical protein